MLSLLNISFLFFLSVTRSSDSIVSIILCWNGFSFTTGLTGWYMCVCVGINIGAWQWLGDCIYSGYTAQPAGTNTGMVWTCSVSCAHYRWQLYWTWGKTTPILILLTAAAVITTKNGEAGINVHDILPVTTPWGKQMMPPADRIYDPGQGAKKDLTDTGNDFLAISPYFLAHDNNNYQKWRNIVYTVPFEV